MSLIIAAAQSTSVPGDISRNVAHHLHIATIAAQHEVRLLVFPELSLTGYELDLARANAIDPDSPLLDPLRVLADLGGLTIVAGAPVPNDEGQLHIGAIIFRPDGVTGLYTKVHVHESEQHVFTSGPGGPILAIEECRVSLAICADASHPQHAAKAAARGAEVYAAGAMISDDAYPRKTALLQRYAQEHRMAVLLSNYAGTTGGEQSAGKSALWGESGDQVIASKDAAEALIIGTRDATGWSGVILPL